MPGYGVNVCPPGDMNHFVFPSVLKLAARETRSPKWGEKLLVSQSDEDFSMRVALLLVAVLGLSACGDGERTVVVQPEPAQTVVVPPQQPTIVIPEGARVICPSGSAAVYSDGVYRC
jgi:hypothetical protein